MDIHGLSEINYGLIILGFKTANMYDPDVFTEPYSQAVEYLKKHPSANVEEISMNFMAPSEYSAAKHAALSVNGLGKTHDWMQDQRKAYKAYKLGDAFIKAGNKYKKNEPVEILPLQGQIQSLVNEELSSGLTKLNDIDYKNFQPFQDSGWDVIDNIFGGIPASGLMVVFGETGVGKCLAKGTKVLMFNGSIKLVEDIVVGDLVMGPDSTARTVMSLSHGMDEMYDVIPTKGEKYTVNSEHILSLRITNKGTGGNKYKSGDIYNISIKDYLKSPKGFRHLAKGYRTGIEFENKEVPIEPYFLGAWLGDGNSDTPNITNMDKEIITYLYDYAFRLELKVGKYYEENRASVYRISSGIPGNQNPLWNKLREMDLIQNKHIPHRYKINSRKSRLELLAGLIDTDGSYSQNCYDLVFKNENLANDIVFVARSLGFAAYVKPCTKICTNNGKSGKYHRITISGNIDEIPVKIPRKKALPRQQKKNVLNVGIRVEPAGYGEYFGFGLDGDHLFVLGDFTVTHNSFWLSKLMDTFLAKHKKKTGATYTLEMTSEEYAQRSVNMYPGLVKASDRFYISGNARTIDEIVAEVSSKRLDIVGIDFVDWLVRDKQGGEAAYAYVYMTCVELARILKIPVVLLAQPNREGYKYDKFLTKTDIRWSGAAEFSAWQLIALQAIKGLGFADNKYPTYDDEHYYMIDLKQRGGWPKQQGPGAVIIKPQKGKGKWEGEIIKNKLWVPGDYSSTQVVGSRKNYGDDKRDNNRRMVRR